MIKNPSKNRATQETLLIECLTCLTLARVRSKLYLFTKLSSGCGIVADGVNTQVSYYENPGILMVVQTVEDGTYISLIH